MEEGLRALDHGVPGPELDTDGVDLGPHKIVGSERATT